MIVELYGWEDGMLKVSSTKLQMDILSLSLKKAKKNTDAILDGVIVSIEVSDEKVAYRFAKAMTQIGVKARFIELDDD